MRRVLTVGKRVVCGVCFGASKRGDVICFRCRNKGTVLAHLPFERS